TRPSAPARRSSDLDHLTLLRIKSIHHCINKRCRCVTVYLPEPVSRDAEPVSTVCFSLYKFTHPRPAAQPYELEGTKLFGAQSNNDRNFRWQVNHPFTPLRHVLLKKFFIGNDGLQRKDHNEHFFSMGWSCDFDTACTGEINVPK